MLNSVLIMMTLIDARPRAKLRVTEILGGKGTRQQLSQLGIQVGSVMTVLRNAPFSGPVMVDLQGTSIVIGRRIAAKIGVEDRL